MNIQLSTDTTHLFGSGFFSVNWTIMAQWIAMLLLFIFSYFCVYKPSKTGEISKTQQLGEALISIIQNQINGLASGVNAALFFPYAATLFLFIFVSNILDVIPFMSAPTASLSMTAGLASTLLFASPFYGIKTSGVKRYFQKYTKPFALLLPFNILDDWIKVLSMTFRLYGNIMSGAVIGSILLALVPFLFPLISQALGLLTGSIQAFVFAALATVAVASGMSNGEEEPQPSLTSSDVPRLLPPHKQPKETL